MMRVAILGAGDLGQLLAHYLKSCAGLEPVAFFDDTCDGTEVRGLPVRGGFVDVEEHASVFDAVLVGVGYRHLRTRQTIFEDLRARGLEFATMVHPSAYVDPSATIDAGAIVFPGCVLDSGVHVRENTLLNTGCVVAHDSQIGPHTFLGPAVQLAGFVELGARSFIGIGTTVIDNITLGDDLQTGGGAVVIEDHPGSALLVGVPAREVHATG